MSKYSDDELMGLSEDERAAVMDGEELDEDLEDDLSLEDAEDDPPEPEEPAEEVDETPEVKPAEPAIEPPEPFVPKLSGETPPEIQLQLATLDKQFEEGEISLGEYNTQRDAIKEQLYDARMEAQRQALIEEQRRQQQQSAEREWVETQQRFFADSDNSRFRDNGVLLNLMDTEVRRLAKDPQVIEKLNVGTMTGMDVLNQAKTNILDAIGAASGTPAVKAAQKPAAARPNVVTLSEAPPAANNSTGDGPFAHLDTLSGAKLEAALARLTPEQADAYLSGRG